MYACAREWGVSRRGQGRGRVLAGENVDFRMGVRACGRVSVLVSVFFFFLIEALYFLMYFFLLIPVCLSATTQFSSAHYTTESG